MAQECSYDASDSFLHGIVENIERIMDLLSYEKICQGPLNEYGLEFAFAGSKGHCVAFKCFHEGYLRFIIRNRQGRTLSMHFIGNGPLATKSIETYIWDELHSF